MKLFIYILSLFSLVSCNNKIKDKSKEESLIISDSMQIKSDSFYGMVVNSGTISDKCFDSFQNGVKYSVCIFYNDENRFISTIDEKFITTESVKIGMKYNDVKLKSEKDIIKESGFAYYFPLKSGWFAAFNLDKTTNLQTITKDSTVSFLFKRITHD